jgi:hypothetical protein
MKNIEIEERFKSQKSICSYETEISALPSVVFPLLCPVLEYDWIDGWSCEMIYTDSGVAEDLCVFKTSNPSFGEETWVCTRYELNKAIRYTRFSDNKIVNLDIELFEMSNRKSRLVWTMSIISLNKSGNELIKDNNQEVTREIYKGINILLEHYITTGHKLVR